MHVRGLSIYILSSIVWDTYHFLKQRTHIWRPKIRVGINCIQSQIVSWKNKATTWEVKKTGYWKNCNNVHTIIFLFHLINLYKTEVALHTSFGRWYMKNQISLVSYLLFDKHMYMGHSSFQWLVLEHCSKQHFP